MSNPAGSADVTDLVVLVDRTIDAFRTLYDKYEKQSSVRTLLLYAIDLREVLHSKQTDDQKVQYIIATKKEINESCKHRHLSKAFVSSMITVDKLTDAILGLLSFAPENEDVHFDWRSVCPEAASANHTDTEPIFITQSGVEQRLAARVALMDF